MACCKHAGFGLWWWSSFKIASIHGNGWICGAYHIICIAGDVFNCSYEVRVIFTSRRLLRLPSSGSWSNALDDFYVLIELVALHQPLECSQDHQLPYSEVTVSIVRALLSHHQDIQLRKKPWKVTDKCGDVLRQVDDWPL